VTVDGFADDVVALDLNYFNVCALLDTRPLRAFELDRPARPRRTLSGSEPRLSSPRDPLDSARGW
jgi:hypothetical protein